MTEPTNPRPPFANSSLAKYLSRTLDAIKDIKTEQQIADEIHYHEATYISMFRRGEVRVPFEIISALAFAINANPAHLLRLALEQYLPDLEAIFLEFFGTIATAGEEGILLSKWRAARGNIDPASTPAIERAVDRMIAVVKSVRLPT
jgi:hypothetical protein